MALTVAGDDEDDEPADGDDLHDDVGDIDAPPVEANTPSVVKRKPGPKPKAK
jgi:hypothetical protein